MPNNMTLQQIRPDFSASTHMLNQAGQSLDRAGDVASRMLSEHNRELALAEEKRRYGTEQARLGRQEDRQKVLDERASMLWDESRAEKERLANAGLLAVAMADSRAVSDRPQWQKDYNAWVANGRQGTEPMLNTYQIEPKQTPVDIRVGQPSYGTPGTALYKEVSGTSPIAPVQVPVTKEQMLEATTAPKKGFALIPQAAEALKQKDPVAQPLPPQYTETMHGSDTKTTKPSIQIEYAKETDKVLNPTTPTEKKEAAKVTTSALEKSLVGFSSGTMPKTKQAESAVLDSIYGSVDPNAQSRQEATKEMTTMLYGLGLTPAQVKEYVNPTIDAIYGDKNDPVSMAKANALANQYSKAIDTANNMGIKGYEILQQNAMENARLSADSAKAAKMDPVLQALAIAAGKQDIEAGKKLTLKEKMELQKLQQELEDAAYKRYDDSEWFPMSQDEYIRANPVVLPK